MNYVNELHTKIQYTQNEHKQLYT